MARRSMIITNPILPDAVQEDRVRLNVLQAIQRTAADVKRDFQRTVATWNHRVTFDIGKRFSRGSRGREAEYGFTVTTDDEIWGWLNEGTAVRYVRMTDDFAPKTTPNVFDSEEGQGGVAGWGNEPGIEARNWTALAEQRYERPLLIAVTNAILLGLENQRLPRRGG